MFFEKNYVTQYLVLKNYICTVKFVNCGKLRRAESWSNEEIDYSSTKWEPGNFHAGKILQGLWCTLGESWPRKIRLDHQKTFTWFTQWVVPKLVLEWYFQQAIQSPHVHGVLACLEHRDVLVSEAHWGLFTEEFLFITCTVYRKTFWKFFMDYVSSTYLISINCFRMLRLMNKKDSGLFGGPESETYSCFFLFISSR